MSSPVYDANRKEWSERYGRYRSEARMWRWVALVSALVAGVAVIDNSWLASQSHVVPFVVQANKLGESITVQRLEASTPFDPARIKPQLARWVHDVRTVFRDPDAQRTLFNEAYAWIDANSRAKPSLDEWYAANRPNVRGLRETVEVTIETVSLLGGDTWIVDWNETSTRPDATAVTTYWRMNVGIKVSAPTSEAEMIANPGGFYIEWFNRMTQRQI